MRWENLSNRQPPPKDFIVAETENDRDLIIEFAQIGDPTPPVRPGLDPNFYRGKQVPVTFNRSVGKSAVRGILEKAQRPASKYDVMFAAAVLLLEELEIPADSLTAAA